MSDREVVLVDLTTSSETRVCLHTAAEIAELLIEEVEWALEEYGVCETGRYQISDTE